MKTKKLISLFICLVLLLCTACQNSNTTSSPDTEPEKDVYQGLSVEEFERLYTDYFYDYDYILGDYAYNKLRLKGFNDKKNKNFNKINNIENYEKYIQEFRGYKSKHFLLKKTNKDLK